MPVYGVLCKELPGERKIIEAPPIEGATFVAFYDPPSPDFRIDMLKAAYFPKTNRMIIFVDLLKGSLSDLRKTKFLLVNPTITVGAYALETFETVSSDETIKSLGTVILPVGTTVYGTDKSIIESWVMDQATQIKQNYSERWTPGGQKETPEIPISDIPSPLPPISPPPSYPTIPADEEKKKSYLWLWLLLGGGGGIAAIIALAIRRKKI